MCDDDDEGEWMMRDTNERWKWENDIEKNKKREDHNKSG